VKRKTAALREARRVEIEREEAASALSFAEAQRKADEESILLLKAYKSAQMQRDLAQMKDQMMQLYTENTILLRLNKQLKDQVALFLSDGVKGTKGR
jgi:hypothetical protein